MVGDRDWDVGHPLSVKDGRRYQDAGWVGPDRFLDKEVL